MKKKFTSIILCFLIIIVTFSLPVIAGSTTIKGYTIYSSNTTVYSNTTLSKKYGTIYPSDELTVHLVKDKYCQVTYPVGKGKTKTGYIQRSALLTQTSGKKARATDRITTYRRNNDSQTYGYIAKNDLVEILGTKGKWTQVKYPVSWGYKYAFIKSADVAKINTETDDSTPEKSVALLVSGRPNKGKTAEKERIGFQRDIQTMSSAISAFGVCQNTTITKITNSDCSDLKKRIKDVFQSTSDDSISYFYYTGHGNKNGFGSIDYYSLVSYLRENTKGTVVVILDVCYSNQFSFAVANSNQAYREKNRFLVLAASTSEQHSQCDDNGANGGFFTNAIKDALKWKNDKVLCDDGDGKITLGELYSYVKKEVQNKTDYLQIPMMFGDSSKEVFDAS